jgi:uncharacterized membrane protein YhaH (DUF805 family)
MGFGKAIKYCLANYATFNGRGLRSEFWWFYLFVYLIQIPFSIIFAVLYIVSFLPAVESAGPDGQLDFTDINWAPMGLGFALLMLVTLALFVPFLAASARRLHDMGQSGHWLWLHLLGLGIVPLVMCILDTEPRDNRWGPDPKSHERPPTSYGPGSYSAPPPQASQYPHPNQYPNPGQPGGPAAPPPPSA